MVPLLSPDPERDFDELFRLLSEFLVEHGVPQEDDGLDAGALDTALRERGWTWRVTDTDWDGTGDYHIALGKHQPGQEESALDPLDQRFHVRIPMSRVTEKPRIGASPLALAISLEAVIRAGELGIDDVTFVSNQLIGLERSATARAQGGPPGPLGEMVGVVPIAQASTGNLVTLILRSLESHRDGYIVLYRLMLGPYHPLRLEQ